MNSKYYIYITSNINKRVLYIGVTNNLKRRLSQHYSDSIHAKKSFAGKYNCYYLLYYEGFDDIHVAIGREKELKKWRREKKNNLISLCNPEWIFLNDDVF